MLHWIYAAISKQTTFHLERVRMVESQPRHWEIDGRGTHLPMGGKICLSFGMKYFQMIYCAYARGMLTICIHKLPAMYGLGAIKACFFHIHSTHTLNKAHLSLSSYMY